MGFIEFTKMAITSLKIGHFHPDFDKSRWPFLATVGLSGGGHYGGQLPWPPRISRPDFEKCLAAILDLKKNNELLSNAFNHAWANLS